jgi:hypothetical protein
MHCSRILLVLAALLLPASAALASERGLVIRAADLYSEPFIDAAKLGPLAANQPVVIVARRGGWVSVEVAGKRGWVRMLNIRLEPATRAPGRPTAGMRTGSTGRTVATGVKGLDEADIRAASVDRAQLAKLDQLGASDGDARAYAAQHKLKESKVAYLKAGRVP